MKYIIIDNIKGVIPSTDDVIDGILGSEFMEGEYSSWVENNEDDPEFIESDEEYRSYLSGRVNDSINNIVGVVKGKIPIYRGLYIMDYNDWFNRILKQDGKVGIYWSRELSGAKAYNGAVTNVIIEGIVDNYDSVDFDETTAIYFGGVSEEEEIRMIEGKLIKIVRIAHGLDKGECDSLLLNNNASILPCNLYLKL